MTTRVLALENDPGAALALRLTFERAGYEVVLSFDGQSGPRMAGEQRPDLVVVDSELLGTDPRPLLDRIRDKAGVPMLLLTSANLAENGYEGVDGWLARPFTSGELLAEVEALLHPAGND
ncbi:DNA-binding response OmpR family regulator [Saccharomonospora amisosensis]|uniref:DNA-binding response OmpR family regulator n=1 Tax=Saccharomonospora amisosensis TaxID=1128677 RepID=A0A7X5US06_9PSEU|nr:response regulator [Saccharomonospora amisosensis]NIJ13144.1 DNA-binding response OmpR family regulator [Saccharomonospora amisosensis]